MELKNCFLCTFSKTDDFWDSQSETYQEAKKALNFLDALDTEDDDKDSDKNSSPKPPSSSWSSQPDTPRSEVSSLAESRYGSYDVNTSVSGSPKINTKSVSNRSPPRFIPPPPPPDSPPPDDPNQWSSKQQMYVSGIRYTKRQHSYDKETILRTSLGTSSNLDMEECVPPVPSKSNLSVFRIQSSLGSPESPIRAKDGSLNRPQKNSLDADTSVIDLVLRKTHASLGKDLGIVYTEKIIIIIIFNHQQCLHTEDHYYYYFQSSAVSFLFILYSTPLWKLLQL